MEEVPSMNLKYHRSEQALNARRKRISNSREGWTCTVRGGVKIRRVQEAARSLCTWPFVNLSPLLG